MIMEQIASYLQTGMWVVVIALTLIGALKGRRRGLFRQLIRTASLVASVFIALGITKIAYNTVMEKASDSIVSTLENNGVSLGTFKEVLTTLSVDSLNHALAIPVALLILPLLFSVSFIAVSILIRIAHALVCRILGFWKWRNNFLTRLLGMILGAVTGFLFAAVCLSPIVGLTSTLSDATEKFEASSSYSSSNEEVKKIYSEYVKPLTNNACAKMLAPLGGDMIYNMVTTIEVNGTTYEMPKETTGSTISIVGAVKSMGGLDFENMSEEAKNALNVIIEVSNESKYMATLFADILDATARIYDTKEIQSGNPLANSISGILSVFIDIKPENVGPTLEVVRDTLFIISINYEDLTESDKASFDNLIASAEQNDSKAATLATILDAVATDINAQATAENDHTGEFVRDLFAVFVDIPKDEVAPTLQVVTDALFMLDDAGALAALTQNAGNLSDIMSVKDENGNNLVKRLTDKFNSLERTQPLVDDITKLSITVISESMPKVDGVEITEETYDNVKGTVKNDIVNINKEYANAEVGTPEYDEYLGAVSDSLSETFVNNGINVEKSVADEMAKYIAENHKDKTDEMSDAEANDIILSYYEAYLQTQNQENP